VKAKSGWFLSQDNVSETQTLEWSDMSNWGLCLSELAL